MAYIQEKIKRQGDLVPFVQFKKRKKYPFGSVTFTKRNTPPWEFSRFLNCTNGTKSRKGLHLY